MSGRFAEAERTEQRVLGALRCVDGTSGVALTGIIVTAPPSVVLIRNRSDLLVIREVAQPPALAAHAVQFAAPPATPALGSVTLPLSLRDPTGRYLPRTASISLPRTADLAQALQPASLFRPIDLPLYPASHAEINGNWAAVRVSVRETGGDALGGALLRIRSAGQVLARGLSDWRGEALVRVPGVPITTWSSDPGAVIVNEINATLEACFDAACGVRLPAAQVAAGRGPSVLPAVDPTALEAAFAGLPQVAAPITLAAGRPLHLALSIDL